MNTNNPEERLHTKELEISFENELGLLPAKEKNNNIVIVEVEEEDSNHRLIKSQDDDQDDMISVDLSELSA